jgi:hypothetical protein
MIMISIIVITIWPFSKACKPPYGKGAGDTGQLPHEILSVVVGSQVTIIITVSVRDMILSHIIPVYFMLGQGEQ